MDVLQDREGYYWIATQNGLNRFDGTSFVIYRHNISDTLSLPHDFCTALLEDPTGDIWVATYNGLARFDKRKKNFNRIPLSTSLHPSRQASRIADIIAVGDSLMWILGDGLWQYDFIHHRITSFTPQAGDNTAPSYFHFLRYAAYDDRLQGIWLSCQDEINFYDFTSAKFFSTTYNPKQWKIFKTALAGPIALDSTGQLWFISPDEKQLCSFHPETNSVELNRDALEQGVMQLRSDANGHIWIFYWVRNSKIFMPELRRSDTEFFRRYHSHSLLTPNCTDVCSDRLGQYWILSAEGISIYNPAIQYYKLYPFDPSSFGSPESKVTVYSITPFVPESICIGTSQGLYQLDLATGAIHRKDLQLKNGALVQFRDRITAVEATEDNLYIGNWDQLWCWNDQSSLHFKLAPRIQSIQQGLDHELWVATWSDGLYRIDLDSKEVYTFLKGTQSAHSLRTNSLLTCVLDSNHIWLGYNGGYGFCRYDIRADSFEHFMPSPGGKTSYGTGTITSIVPGPDVCWLGTYGGGLLRFDRRTGEYDVFQQEHGLKSNYINSALLDSLQRLWISTSDGLNVLDIRSGQIQSLNIDLGFPSNDYFYNSCRGPSGKLYFFNFNKIVVIDPAAFRFDTLFPEFVMSAFKIREKESPLPAAGQTLRLPFKENYFSFSFSAIKNHPGIRTRYAYRLAGFDPEWIETSHPQAVYTNVRPGTYQFEVRVMNAAGQWSPVVWTRTMRIHPPFWQTWWFISLITFVAGATLLGIHRYRIQQVKKIYSIRTQISRDLHDDIGASLSSIHIYSTVAEEELTVNPEMARTYLQQINTNSRQVMEDISDIVWANRLQNSDHAPLDARIKNYGYDLLSQKNIACIYRIHPEAEKMVTKPDARRNVLMIIKEAINNISKYSEATQAEIELSLEGKEILLRIQDDGRGFDATRRGNGNGIPHMKNRATVMSGNLTITTAPGAGTLVICRIPIANISDT
jgi:ligand-binding sensor domain-containing protein